MIHDEEKKIVLILNDYKFWKAIEIRFVLNKNVENYILHFISSFVCT